MTSTESAKQRLPEGAAANVFATASSQPTMMFAAPSKPKSHKGLIAGILLGLALAAAVVLGVLWVVGNDDLPRVDPGVVRTP
ncbi:MAG: hypothetical protein LBR58_11720 [Propionibacteriaceae bacterium]|nr:hypothetical protein [Propionibacteriaceae bacterium]